MLKIGMVDFYLDNWHANHYPAYIREAAERYGFDADICYAYAEQNSPLEWGLTTAGWCEMQGIEPCGSYEELLEKADAIMVMGADDCRDHERLASKALQGGKPVYCDKTFAPNVEAAERMFALAAESGTPVFSCSAQRFCPQLQAFLAEQKEKVNFGATTGPGDMVNYSVHQIEMLQAVMGIGAKRCQAFVKEDTRHILYEYEDDRMATFTQAAGLPFHLFAGNHSSGVRELAVGDYYMPFMEAMLQFFTDQIPPVKPEETLEIMRMQQAARQAIEMHGVWVEVCASGDDY